MLKLKDTYIYKGVVVGYNTMKQETIRKVKCKCGHTWETKSKLLILVCANCNQKVKLKELKK